jgi:SSS family solute:Na+ symporter
MLVGEGDLFEGMSTLMEKAPEKFNVIGNKDSSIPFGTIFTGMMLVQLFYWGTNQAIIQRALGAKNLKEGQKGLIYAAFIKILGPLIVVLPGVIAFYLFGESLENPDEAYPELVKKVLPAGLVGFFAAVLFGAILSSFNSALNSSVTLFGLDIYKSYIHKEASEKQVVWAGKKFGIVLAVLSMFIAPLIANAPDGLYGYLQEVNGCYSIPILTIIVVGYFTRYVPAIAAKIAIASGVVLYSISQFILKPFVVGEDNYPHFLHVMALLFVFNVLVMLLIGKLNPMAKAFELPYTQAVDIVPWKHVKLAGGIACAIVIYSYFYFS